MLVNLLGVKTLDFMADDGNRVQGTQLHVSYEEEGVSGFACDKIFVKHGITIPAGLKQGDVLELRFNRKGRAEAVLASK
jgi:hypothetical protein